MLFDVPFVSQYADLGRHEWRARGCGIASLKMVLDFYGTHILLEELLSVGLELGAYREGIGWSHGGLVSIAERYGYRGYNADWGPKSSNPKTAPGAWDALMSELAHGPVLASVHAGFDAERPGGHIVAITGYADGLVLLNDPEQMHEREGRRALALDAFLKAFKRRYIVIRPTALP